MVRRILQRLRPSRRLIVALLAAVALIVIGCVTWIRVGARDHVYDADTVPSAPVALVLGAQVRADGIPAAFLSARLALAQRLYDTGKVRAILVSGDHGAWAYDEPGAMKRWLVDRGVPAGKVVEDHAGFDTYDSCARAARIFGVRRAIVVTQSFHVRRAVTLCRSLGVEADGVGDESVRRFRSFWWRGTLRENGAAVKAAFDVLTGRDPVFLGPHEPGVDAAVRAG